MFHFTGLSFARTDRFVKSMAKQTRKSDIGAGVSSNESERDVFGDQPAETVCLDRSMHAVSRHRGAGKSSRSAIRMRRTTKTKSSSRSNPAAELSNMKRRQRERPSHLLVACSRSKSRSGLLAATGVNSRFCV